MIYYSINKSRALQNVTYLITREFDLAVGTFQLDAVEAIPMLNRWIERYHLLETPQQTYRRRLNGEAVFSLLVDFSWKQLNSEHEEDSDNKQVLVDLTLFCRGSERFFFDAEKGRQLDPKKDIDSVNSLIRKQVKNAEIFQHISEIKRVIGKYELVQLTKKSTSIAELKANDWTKTNHATNWTWRLTAEALKEQVEQGQRLINRFQNVLEKNDVTLAEKKAYFEKHFKALEGYLGYRGVRQQIGKLYHDEAKIFKTRYQRNWLDHGGRKLNLSYIKASKNWIPNNSDYLEAHNKYRELLSKHLMKNKESKEAK